MKYVIIGGDAAGMSAAMQIVRNSSLPHITVLEQGNYYSYSQCGLPYLISGDVVSVDELIARNRETFVEKYGINATVFHHVTSIDPDKKQVTGIKLDENRSFSVDYDKLLIASGASPIIPNWPGVDLGGVHVLKTIPDAEGFIQELKDRETIAIIGGGYIGLEVAESLSKLGKKVRLIQRSDSLGASFDQDMSQYIEEEASKYGIQVHLNESVSQICGNEWVSEIKTDQRSYPADLVLIAVGVEPNTSFISGIEKNRSNAIVVDKFLKSSIPDIYAAGDCATHYHRIKQLDDFIPLGTTANKQGQLAGLNMVGMEHPFRGVVGTGVLRFFGLTLARTGLAKKEVEDLGIEYETAMVKTMSNASYMPNASSLHLKILYDPKTNRLLGGQAVGAGADKRIDVLATALYANLTITELLDLDLSYAPPYNSVWDPVQQLARKTFSTKKLPR